MAACQTHVSMTDELCRSTQQTAARDAKYHVSVYRVYWVNEIRYLGIFIVKSRYFKCSLDYAERSFYRAANSIFGQIGRIASEEVTLQLLYSKCVPVLLYGLEACRLNISDFRSLDFVIDRFFMKLFKTNNIDTVRFCQIQFGCQLPSIIIQSRILIRS